MSNEQSPLIAVKPSIELHSSREHSRDAENYTTSFDTFKGMLYMFLSCVLKSFYGFLCKFLLRQNADLTSYHLLTYKVYIMIAIGAMLLIGAYRWHPRTLEEIMTLSQINLIQLVIRAVLAVFSGSLTILSLKHMAISDVFAIYYLYPGIVILLSYAFLKERVAPFDLICLLACCVGVICVIRPSVLANASVIALDNEGGVYVLFVLLAAVFKAVEDILIRNLGKQVHYLSIPIVYSVVGIILFPFPMLFFTETHSIYCLISYNEVTLLIVIAIVSFGYHTLLAMSIQNENVGRASMINYFQVLFMFISDIFVFNRNAILFDYIGIGMIFSFNFTNGVFKAYKRTVYLHQVKQQEINQ